MVFVAARAEPVCGYCKGELTLSTAPFCKGCGHPIHLDCWDGFGGCATPFCDESPGFEASAENEKTRASYEGLFPNSTKFCPNCGELREGIFCGKCGVDFVLLDTRQEVITGGRPPEDLIGTAQDNISERPDSMIRGKTFRQTQHCLNCGLKLPESGQCSRCLYES